MQRVRDQFAAANAENDTLKQQNQLWSSMIKPLQETVRALQPKGVYNTVTATATAPGKVNEETLEIGDVDPVRRLLCDCPCRPSLLAVCADALRPGVMLDR